MAHPRDLAALERRAARRGDDAPLRLPVPIPGPERRLETRSDHHLLGQVEYTVRRGGRIWHRHAGEAALEDGSVAQDEQGDVVVAPA